MTPIMLHNPHVAKQGSTLPRSRGESRVDDEEQRYARAKARVEELKGFYSHFAVYIVVNIGLFALNVLTSEDWWFYWPLFGWGIGLLFHGTYVFLISGRMAGDWEQRKIREFMEKDRKP